MTFADPVPGIYDIPRVPIPDDEEGRRQLDAAIENWCREVDRLVQRFNASAQTEFDLHVLLQDKATAWRALVLDWVQRNGVA